MRLCGLQSVPLLLTCLKMLLLLHQFWCILSLAPTASEFILETDASYVGLGAVLPQRQEDGKVHPIAYASRSLDFHEKKYGVTELETLGLVWVVRYFRPYLLGHRTTVFTDDSACLSLLNHPRPSGKLARWAITSQEMDLDIKHCSGKSNTNADALSHNPVH